MNIIEKVSRSFIKAYKSMSFWYKTLLFTCILLLLVMIYNKHYTSIKREGFQQKKSFVTKSGLDVYDNFYATIYDDLTYDSFKNNYEIGEVMRFTKLPVSKTIVLDIGSGTGHHCKLFSKLGCEVYGVDKSAAMVSKAKEKHPKLNFRQADALASITFPPSSFSLINCMYFTIYYIKDKHTFLKNCYSWLKPQGYLALHLVNRDKFDPVLNVADPLVMVSAQKYAKKRITNSIVKFKDFQYKADFKLKKPDNTATFLETFKDDVTGNVRKNEHVFYIQTQKEILGIAKDIGFILKGRIDMVACQYEYQYVYILYKQ